VLSKFVFAQMPQDSVSQYSFLNQENYLIDCEILNNSRSLEYFDSIEAGIILIAMIIFNFEFNRRERINNVIEQKFGL